VVLPGAPALGRRIVGIAVGVGVTGGSLALAQRLDGGFQAHLHGQGEPHGPGDADEGLGGVPGQGPARRFGRLRIPMMPPTHSDMIPPIIPG